MNMRWLCGLALLACSGIASAQNPVANLVVGADHAAVNLNNTVNSLLVGDSGQTMVNLDETVSTLLYDLTAGTPLVALAETGSSLTSTVANLSLGMAPSANRLTQPLMGAASPVTRPLIATTDALLAQGLPVADRFAPLPVGQAPQMPLLGDDALLGGLPLVGNLIGTGDARPLVGGIFGGENGLFAGVGPAPIFGGFLNGAALSGGGNGLSADALPLPAERIDPATRAALANDVRLQGL